MICSIEVFPQKAFPSISSTIETIEYAAFFGCNNLKNIDNANFASLNGAVFNKNITTLLFYLKKKKAKIYTIPNTVTTIGEYAFKDSVNLVTIIIPHSVSIIDDAAFYGCKQLSSFRMKNYSFSYIGNSAFHGCIRLVSVDIRETKVTIIRKHTFYGCKSLVNVILPSLLCSIDAYAFFGCLNLKIIEIPLTVRSLGYAALQSSIENLLLKSFLNY